MMLFQRATLAAMSRVASAGVLARASMHISYSGRCTSGAAAAFSASRESRLTTARGVPRGAEIPVHDDTL